MLKKIAIVAFVAIVLLVGGVLYVLSQADAFVRRGIERGGTYVLEVPVTVDAATLDIGEGRLGVTGLRVANPEGFGTADERFVRLGDGDVQVSYDTSDQEVVRLPRLALSDLEMLLIKGAEDSNYGRILDSVKRFEDDTPPPADPPAGAEATQTRVVIDEVVLSDLMVRIRYASGVPGADALTTLDVPIDEIRLENVGEDPDNPVDVADTVSIILKAVLAAVIEEAGGVLPPDLAEDLETSLAELASLGDMGVGMATELGEGARQQLEEVGRQVEQAIGEVGGSLGEALEGAGQQAGDAAERAGEELRRGIGGLMQGGGSGDGSGGGPGDGNGGGGSIGGDGGGGGGG